MTTRATVALDQAGISYDLHPYDLGRGADADSYGEAVASVLGVDPDRLFKTLVFDVDGEATIAIASVGSRVSTKKLAQAVGGKRAEMVAPDYAERLTGYVTGGISPFGQRRTLRAVVDEMVTVHDRVFVSGGRRGLQIELDPIDLIDLVDASIADITA